MDDGTHHVERLLREYRPAPRADFVRELEAELLARTRKGDRFRVLVAGAALCATLAALTLMLSIAGLLPWSIGSGDRARAGSDCVTTVVVRHERRPVLVVDADGTIRTEDRIVAVRKPVKRCR
jgi:hypothetical protein